MSEEIKQEFVAVNKALLFRNWTVIRFWDDEIKKNTEECVRMVEETVFKMKMEETIGYFMFYR